MLSRTWNYRSDISLRIQHHQSAEANQFEDPRKISSGKGMLIEVVTQRSERLQAASLLRA